MWNEIEVAEAPPVMVLVAASGCLRSTKVVAFAKIDVVVKSAVLEPAVPIERVNVPPVAEVFVTAMLVTIQVVEAGTVANTVVVVVVAAPRKKVVGVVAIVAP